MSHTFEQDGWTISYNPDLSGDVTITTPPSSSPGLGDTIPAATLNMVVEMPGKVLIAFLAEWMRREKAAALEQASDFEVLGLKEKP